VWESWIELAQVCAKWRVLFIVVLNFRCSLIRMLYEITSKDSEDVGDMHFRNVGNRFRDYTAS
jgi:hypothetical protein